MKLAAFPFQTLDWSALPTEIHTGITGFATWQIFRMNDIRIRMVEYSAGYLADHWCRKGHIIYCIEGEMETRLEDGRSYVLSAGMSYQAGDEVKRTRAPPEMDAGSLSWIDTRLSILRKF